VKKQEAEVLEQIAWRVLADLCRPDGAFATYEPDALRGLIAWRLAEEARRASVSLEALTQVFEQATCELTGSSTRHAPPSAEESGISPSPPEERGSGGED
jgi:hypothetical protein